MDHVVLNNEQKIPMVGLGTWQFNILTKTYEDTKSKPGEVKQAVTQAIKLGYRLIDCAYSYGNEAEIGEALNETINDGTVKREDLFIVTKLWNTFHNPDSVEKAINSSLSNLGLKYIDLYLIHWPCGYMDGQDLFPKDKDGNILFSDVDYMDTWKAMENLVDQGLCKGIGLSNFNIDQIQRVVDNSRIKPAMLQIEMHPYLPCLKTQEVCSKNGIALTAYSPLGSPNRPSHLSSNNPPLLEDSNIKAIGDKYGKAPAQVILRYLVQRNVCVIPKSVNPDRLKANLNIFDFELTAEEMTAMNSFNVNERFIFPTLMREHKYFPYKDRLE